MSSSVFLGTRILKKWKYFYSKGFCSLCFICLTPNDSNSGTTCQIFFPRFRWQKSINWIGIFKTLNIISFHIWARKSLDVRPARFLQCQLSRMFRFSVKGKQRVQFVSDIHIDSAATNNPMSVFGDYCQWSSRIWTCQLIWSSCDTCLLYYIYFMVIKQLMFTYLHMFTRQ